MNLKLDDSNVGLIFDSLAIHRNKLLRESKYDGVPRTRKARMVRKIKTLEKLQRELVKQYGEIE